MSFVMFIQQARLDKGDLGGVGINNVLARLILHEPELPGLHHD